MLHWLFVIWILDLFVPETLRYKLFEMKKIKQRGEIFPPEKFLYFFQPKQGYFAAHQPRVISTRLPREENRRDSIFSAALHTFRVPNVRRVTPRCCCLSEWDTGTYNVPRNISCFLLYESEWILSRGLCLSFEAETGWQFLSIYVCPCVIWRTFVCMSFSSRIENSLSGRNFRNAAIDRGRKERLNYLILTKVKIVLDTE